MIIRVLSAYCSIGYFWPKSSSIGRFNIPLFQASFIIDCNNSDVLTNNSGDNGSPYLTPLLHNIFFPGTPFSKTEVEGDNRIDLTSEIHLGPKPFA
jgi:hypothetical protein